MPLRFTALGALVLTAGCATRVSNEPAAKPRAVHAARWVAVTLPVESAATGKAPVAAIPKEPPPDAVPPLPSNPPTPPLSPTPPAAPSNANADPFGDVGFKEVNEKEWLAGIRDKIAQREKIAPTDLRLSPGLLRAAFVRSSPVAAPARPGKRVPPRRHEIVVVDNQGRRVASFRPIVSRGSNDPPSDLRFLSDERLVYEVIIRAPAAAPPRSKRLPATRAKDRFVAHRINARLMHEVPRATPPVMPSVTPSAAARLFIIQPLAPRARPIRCQGFHFTFTREHDRLAFVGGQAGAAFVAVDGAQVYPRRGRTVVASAPVWSKDGRSLAFLELPAGHPARLVLVAEFNDPAGDVTWDLPVDAKIDGASVSWAGTGKLIVKKAAMRPIFSASFVTER
jgi:hypothetical protein